MKLDWYVRRPAKPELSFKIPVKTYSFDTSERRAFLPTPPRNLLTPNSRDMRERLAAIYIDDEMRKMREKEQRSKTKAANIRAALDRQDKILEELQGGRADNLVVGARNVAAIDALRADNVAANARNVAAIDAVRAEFPNVVGAVDDLGRGIRENMSVAVGSEKSLTLLETVTGVKPDTNDRMLIMRRLAGADTSKKEFLLSDILRTWEDILAGRSGVASTSSSVTSLQSSIQSPQPSGRKKRR